jgi:N-acetylmuramoyl-L-alanine amidase
VVDPGHGGHDSGAIGRYSPDAGGYNVTVLEKDVNLNIGLYARRYLLQNYPDNFLVMMTRKDDTYLTLQSRCEKAQQYEADLFISVHCNAFDEVDDTVPGVTGIETYYYWEDAKRFGNILQNNIIANFPDHKNRGLKKYRYYVVKNSVPEAVLLECEFIDEMPEWLNRENIQRRFGLFIGEAVRKYYLT